ncbi:bacteriorhodopsin [Halobaculum sp. MBLA0147]|uniref:bacteriorhodopsin n=1 Tax=Halobaculum sp. MBLA0147 TaxID=3079934 RepID=UPI0035267C65
MSLAALQILSERPESIWLGIGFVAMLLGTFYFIAKGWGVTDPEQQEFYILTIMVPAIAAASYLSMFLGFGVTEVEVGGRVLDIYWARYADWLFTTPLLLLDLALLANADRNTIYALVLTDAFMIVTGLVGALENNAFIFRYVWWTVSTISFVFLLYMLFGALTSRVEDFDEDTKTTFIQLRNIVLVLWVFYPIVWIVGTEGAGIVPLFTETLLYMVLDVTAKVGFGFILLRSRAIVGDSSAPTPSAEGEAAD